MKLRKVVKGRVGIVVLSTVTLALLLTGLIPFLPLSAKASPRVHAAGLNPIQIENNKPGTPGWNDFSASLQQDLLSGFGSQISVNLGGSIDFYVTTTAPSFTIDIYRTGYYQGIGARLIESLGSFPGLHQAIPAPDPVTGMISCTSWTKTTTLTVPSNWVTGIYLAKLTDPSGDSSFIFFVVRNDGGNEDILFQASVTTYEAYNTWGGTSLYNNDLSNKAQYPYPHATKDSFDRPFNPGDSNGAGQYFWYEYKFVYWMEEQGYNVAYTTDVDTDARPSQLLNHKAFLSVGHDEYWSMGMRNAVQNAINAGVNVAFFSANVMYWQIRFEPNSTGVADRVEVGYKDFAEDSSPPGPDPQWNVNNSLVTTNWRDPVVNMPENGMLGVMYEQQEDNDYAYVVANAANWIYAGTGFVDGTTIPGIVGYEYDRIWNNGFTPSNLTVLSNSPVHGCCGGYSSFSNSTLYTAPSGARVFAAGTIQWSLGLAAIQGNTYTNAGIQQTTANILNNFIGASSTPSQGVSISAESLSFGNQGVNSTSAVQTVNVTNSGTAALTISKIAVTGTNASDFAQTNNCPGSLAVNASCAINVTFKPTASGARSGNITLTDSSVESPQVIVLSGTGIASGSAVNVSATNISFGNQLIGTTSPTQTIKVTNTGVATLTFSFIQIQGLNANDFAQSNNCPTNLAVGASCTISVTFTPAASGTRAGNVTLIDNASDSPEQVVLSGTGVTTNPAVTLNPLNVNYGNQNVGTTSKAQTVTLTNSGGSALTISTIALTGTNLGDFAQTNNCPLSPSTLAANASCTFTVTFTPQNGDAGTLTASIAVTDNGSGSPQMVTLNGTGVEDNPIVGLNPTLLNFGNQNDGTTSSAQTITLTNVGNAALSISNIAITGTNPGDFAQTNNCPASPATLAVNASCTISVTFTPTSPGARNANVTFTDNADGEGEATQIVTLNGTGIATGPAVSLNPTSLTYSNQNVGTTSSPQSITLTNSGNAALSISSIGLTGTNAGDFAQTNTCPTGSSTLAAGASCTINVTFTPTSNGSRSANISITDNGLGSPQTVALSGTGIATSPAVSLNPTSLTYSNQNVGTTSSPQSITLTNSGNAALSISSIGLTGTNAGDFAQTNTCPTGSSTLATGASCTISVTFTPTANGSRSASLSLADNAAGSPQTVALSGTGTTPGVYFNDGFESGNFSQWNLSSQGTGQASVQSGVVNSGNDAAQFTNTAGQTISVATALTGGPQSLTYTRFYFRFASMGTSPIAYAQNASGKNIWLIYYDAGRQGLDVYFWNGAGQRYDLYSNANVLSANTWYSIEIEANESTSGVGQVWLNGMSIGTVSGDLSTSAPYSKLTLDDEAVGTAYFDDVQVASSYNGLIAPAVSLNPTSLTFSNQNVGTTSSPQSITLTNSGNAALSISSIGLTGTNAGDFAQTNTCPTGSSTLAAGASCTINVTFTPTSGGSRSASVIIGDNGPGSPQSIVLTGTGVASGPSVSLNPTSLTFSNQNVGTTSSAQPITLTNSGGSSLSISSIGLTGTNAGDFAQTNTCPNSLAVNASCTINVTFTPTGAGSRSASVSIADNGPGSPQIVVLGGTGTTPGVYFSDGFESGNFSQWNLSSQGTGQASVQSGVVNSGNDAAQFTNTTGQTISVATALTGGPQSLTYTRFYFRFASMGTSPIAYAQGASGKNIWLIYYDAGRQGLDIYFWNGAGQRYDLYSNANVLSANTWYSIEIEANESTSGAGQVWLNGTSIGTVSGDLSTSSPYSKLTLDDEAVSTAYFDDVVVANTYNGPIQGSAPAVSLNPTSLTYSNQNVGTTSSPQSITLTNSGNAALSISSIGLTGTNAGDFAQTNTCPTGSNTLAAGASCTINVTFTPTGSGSRSASVSIADNAAGSPQNVALSGSGVASGPSVSLNPTSLTFSNQNVGTTSSAQSITLTNSGGSSLSISSIGLTGTNAGDFAQTNTCPIGSSTLAAGASCTINVTFTPTGAGSRSASVSIADNGPGSPQIVVLGGTGTTPGVYFNDGFESGNFSQWNLSSSGTGQASVQSGVVNSGNDAAQFTNTSGQTISVATALAGGPQNLTYTRFYFHFASMGTSPIAYAQNANGGMVWLIYYDAGRQGLDVYFWNGAGQRFDLYSNTNVLSANTWYSIEIEANESTSGLGEVWLNGVAIGTVSGDLSTSTPYSKLTLDDEAVGTAYFDDVQVSSSYNGPV